MHSVDARPMAKHQLDFLNSLLLLHYVRFCCKFYQTHTHTHTHTHTRVCLNIMNSTSRLKWRKYIYLSVYSKSINLSQFIKIYLSQSMYISISIFIEKVWFFKFFSSSFHRIWFQTLLNTHTHTHTYVHTYVHA